MLLWVVALLVGAGAAVWTYGWKRLTRTPIVAMVLRAIAVAGVCALLFNVVAGARRPPPALVALDVSASWRRGHDSTAFADAVRRARADGPNDAIAFGDSARPLVSHPASVDRATRVRPAVERALATGRPLEIITDGEIDDPDALSALPSGSHVVLVGAPATRDLAVRELRLPRAAVGGDTLGVDVVLSASESGAPASHLTVDLGTRRVVTIDVDSLGPYGERLQHVRVPVPSTTNGPSSLILRAIATTTGDAERGNDTLAVVLDVAPGAGAVLVSTSPDFDTRELAAVLRGTVSLPTRVFYRLAPNVWREDGTMASVTEDDVRRAARQAPLLILAGDTTVFGSPRGISQGALLLVAPPEGANGEWFATGTPESPIAPMLAGSPWDSLPPLDVSAQVPTSDFEILETRRARRLDRRVAAVGWDHPRRVVLVAASGFGRWRFRGGASSTVFAAFWGGVIDWLSAERSDIRAALPVENSVRAGQPVQWRRGAPTDTVVQVRLTREAPVWHDSLTLRFPGGTLFAESPPLDPGIYDVDVRGGNTKLVVNSSAELLPRRPTVRAGAAGAAASLSDAPRVRTFSWIFGLVIAALCAEWILRRRQGLH